MGFMVIDKQPGGHSGQISIGLAGKQVEKWTIVGDSGDYTIEDLRYANIFPAVYTSFHPQNYRLRFQPVDIEQDEENPAIFTATLTWSSEKFDPKKEDEQEDDPLNRRAKVRQKTGHMRETRHRDFYGKPKLNAAGDLFDPQIENNTSYRIIKIRKNVTVFPDWTFDFDDCVNSEDFYIKGKLIKKGCAWMADIDLGDENTEGPITYAEANIEIWVKKKRKTVGEETYDDVPEPWDTEQLNEGLYQKIAGKKVRCKVKDEDDPTKKVNAPCAVPLDLDGKQIENPTLDNVTFITFRDNERRDFNDIAYLWSDA